LAPERLYYRTDGRYRGRAPFFYDVEDLPWARRLRAQSRAIRQEYEDNVRAGRDQVSAVFNPAGPSIPGWRSVNFQTYLWRYHRARRAFPVTIAALEQIPGLISAYINVLEPHSTIPPHQGDSDAIMRVHLGLDVPAGDCALRVGSETRGCGNGTLLAFCDAHDHESWNRTAERRVVLVMDVVLPAHERRKRWICANVLSATAVVWFEARLAQLRRDAAAAELHRSGKTVPLPQAIRTGLRRALGIPVYLWLPVQRRLGG
jgi:aspartyl/asparaginyl beta-hydroxylase (cupin superfamily)